MAKGTESSLRTVSLESLLEQARRKPFEVFRACPIAEVRQACLKALRDNPYYQIGEGISPEQLEGLIRDLRAAHGDFWEELFHWYAQFAGEKKHLHTGEAVRALEFAIDFSLRDRGVLHEAAKAVSDKLRKQPRLYWEAPSMVEFLQELLAVIRHEQGGYDAGAWHLTERAVRRIVAAEDVTFLGHLAELHRLHRDGVIQPSQFCQREDPFVGVMNEALLAEAIRQLSAAKEAQTPDLDARVGSALRQKAGLEGSVVVELDYPFPGSFRAAANEPVAVLVSLRATRDSEREKILAVLTGVTVELQSECSLGVKHREKEGSGPEWLPIGEGWGFGVTRKFTDKAVCEFLVRSLSGRRRLWLKFRDGERELASLAIYLTFK